MKDGHQQQEPTQKPIPVTTPTEYWFWRHTDERGRRRTTRYRLTRAEALASLRDPEPVESSREVRNLPDTPGEYQTPGDFLKASSEPFFKLHQAPPKKDPPAG